MTRFLLYILVAFLLTWAIGFGLVTWLGYIGLIPEIIIGIVLGFLAADLAFDHSRRSFYR